MIDALEITVNQLNAISPNTYFLLDVREQFEKNIADIGGILIPINQITRFERINLDKDKKIIIYCHHGIRSLAAVQYLRSLGFKDSWSLHGGIDLWAKFIDNSISLY